jgi:acyl carrier protein
VTPAVQSRLTELLEEATQSPESSLDADLQLEAVDGWDSMGAVMFLGLVREHFRLELSVYDLRDCITVGELTGRIEAKLGV